MRKLNFIHCLSHLPGPFSFYTALEKKTIFSTIFSVSYGESSPLPSPAGAPESVWLRKLLGCADSPPNMSKVDISTAWCSFVTIGGDLSPERGSKWHFLLKGSRTPVFHYEI